VPIATTPDQLALQASIRDWAKRAAPLAALEQLTIALVPGPILGASTQVGERVLGLPR
jgi:hypothetical protein